MADYQEYRRRILRKRWRRTFAVAGLLVLLILLSAVGLLWKHLHREQSPAAVQGSAPGGGASTGSRALHGGRARPSSSRSCRAASGTPSATRPRGG